MRAILIAAMVVTAPVANAWAGPLPSLHGSAPDVASAPALPDADVPAQPHSSPPMYFLRPPTREAVSRPPTLWAPQSELHYRPDADQLTHFDPTNMQVFGGLIGGNQVKDGTGAVVSLTWPIER